MRTETWYKILCCGCDAVNWVCDGDTSDLTGRDVEGFVCRLCGVPNPMVVDESTDPEEYEIGLENPN